MSAPVTPAPETLQSAPALSEVERITNIYYAPNRTFADIRRSAAWWAPFLLMIVSSCAFVYTMQAKVGWDQVVENMRANMSEKQKERMEQLPPEQQQRQAQGMKMGVRYTSYAFPIFILVITAVFAAVLMATFNFGLGAEISYPRAFAVAMYSNLPSVVKTLLVIITLFAGANPENFNLENPLGTNPAFYVDRSSVGAAYPLLQMLDIFTIWMCVLLGMGFAVVGGKKKSTGVAVVLGWLALVTLVRMGFAAAF